MDSCVSTSRRGPTSRVGRQMRSKPLQRLSIHAHARPLVGERLQKR